MFYRIGLDIGIASVGWCVVETDASGEPLHILELGSRIFDKAEVPKTGAPLAEARRLARGLRRRLRRKAYRLQKAREIFLGQNVVPDAGDRDVNELRADGLDKMLSPQEFAAVLMLLMKRRGFASNSKAQTEAEDGKLKKALKENDALMKEKGYRTVGEMLAKECVVTVVDGSGAEKTVYLTRNKAGQYTHTVSREAIRSEMEMLFDAQSGFGNPLASASVRDAIMEIFDWQRNFDEGPGKGSPYSAEYKVGKCEFLPDEERAPKSSATFERFAALQKVNHLRIAVNGEVRKLTEDERKELIAAIDSSIRTDYKKVRKVLRLNEDARFVGLKYYSKKKKQDDPETAEKRTFVSFERSRAIADRLLKEHRDTDTIDAVAYVLAHAKSDDKRRTLFAAYEGTKVLSADEIESLLAVDGSKFGHLSVKAMRKILPHLENGARYDEACKLAGFDHSRQESGGNGVVKWSNLRDELSEINSPVVRRAISQTVKVVKAIVIKYGAPVAINVELARDMGKSAKERSEEATEQNERRKYNDTLRDQIVKDFNVAPTRERLVIRKLYDEQNGKCPYTGEVIDINRLYETNYVQVDHIIPYSRSFNDSFNNKVLVKTRANQEKGNKTPFEWLFTTEKWNDFFDRVCVMYAHNTAKKFNLLRESFDENEMKDRALNDTRYISRFMLGFLRERIAFAECSMGPQRTVAVKGAMTAQLRKQWGIGKIREDGDIHHAVDAAIIACVTPRIVQRLSLAYKQEREGTVKAHDAGRISEPYQGFADELAARCLPDEGAMKARLLSLGRGEQIAEDVKPIFVSRMPRRKAKGALHQETVKSAKHIEDSGVLVKKVALQELKLGKDENGIPYIKNYFRPEDDRRTYELLLSKLVEAEGNAKVAFKEKVYKPTKDGRQGNEIKKVKLYESVGAGVYCNVRGGVAGNDSMVRVDIFSKAGKYYCVPVYAADVYAGRSPMKAAAAGKRLEDWTEIDETYKFEFALYPNDLIWIKHKSGIKLVKQHDNTDSKLPETQLIYEGYVYYKGFNISTAAAAIITHDNCYAAPGIGLKTLEEIRKCSVDALGNVSFVREEKRPPAAMKKQSKEKE